MEHLSVVEHYLDPAAEVYQLVIGYIREIERPVVDDQGQPVLGPGTSVTDDEGHEIDLPGEPLVETVAVVEPVEEFTFYAGDPRYEGKTDDEIAKDQKRVVREALRKREAEAAPPTVNALPGVGQPL